MIKNNRSHAKVKFLYLEKATKFDKISKFYLELHT